MKISLLVELHLEGSAPAACAVGLFLMFCSPGVSLLAIVFETLYIFEVTVVVKSVVMLDT